MSHNVKILKITQLTHNVKSFLVEKPPNYTFTPGQATSINKHSFTFTSLNTDPNLEFTIKIYPVASNPSHSGTTERIGKTKVGDELTIKSPWGAIEYKGPGVFIAGGAGITPFIAIFRQLHKDGKLVGNTLIFSNKTKQDVILEDELKSYFGKNLKLVFTQQGDDRINKKYLEENIKNFDQHFYVCGPHPMVRDITKALKSLNAKSDNLIFEK